MGDENQILKDIAKEAYTDGGKPVVKSTGELFGLIPRIIKAFFTPVELWTLKKEYMIKETTILLEQKLKNISPENIESPKTHIAIPALQYMSYCMDEEELRNMYANLLANSMNKVVKNGVHPSFVEIIKQLCPDEAKILKYIFKEKAIPTLSIRAEKKKNKDEDIIKQLTTTSVPKYIHFSIVGEQTKCEKFYEINKYFYNLIRLGLLEPSPTGSSLSEKEKYEPLKNHIFIDELKKHIFQDPEYNIPLIQEEYMQITSFGQAFCEICIEDPSDIK